MSLKEQRVKKGYTAKELGAITGISYRTIQNMESGKNSDKRINSYSLEGLCRLAIALDCSLLDLLTDKELKAKLKIIMKNHPV